MNPIRNLSIRTQLLLLPFYSVVLFALILFVLGRWIAASMLEENSQATNSLFSEIERNVAASGETYARILASFAYNSEVQDYLTESDPRLKYESFLKVNNLVENNLSIKDGIVDVILLTSYGKPYFLKGDSDRLRQVVGTAPEGALNWFSGVQSLTIDRFAAPYFVAVSTIFSINPRSHPHEDIGRAALVIDAREMGLGVSPSLRDDATTFYLVDRNGWVYSSNDRAAENTRLDPRLAGAPGPRAVRQVIDGRRYLLRREELPQIGGAIISRVPETVVLASLYRLRRLIYGLTAAAVVLLLIPFLVILSNVLSPLRNFVAHIKAIKDGSLPRLAAEIHLEGYSEITLMAGEFNSMLRQIDTLTDRLLSANLALTRAELEKKKAELSYLRSQINPHFLHNTLETIRGAAVIEKAEMTLDMVGSLARMFRYCVTGGDWVTLREEMQIIRSYVHIQLIRFSSRFRVEYDLDEDALDAMVPKMLLQPVVENAFRHGLEGREGQGTLTISGHLAEGVLTVSVGDNGRGMDDTRLALVSRQLRDGEGTSSGEGDGTGSIGLANVSNRIKLLYGERYGVTITSEPARGTLVTLALPGRTDGVPAVPG